MEFITHNQLCRGTKPVNPYTIVSSASKLLTVSKIELREIKSSFVNNDLLKILTHVYCHLAIPNNVQFITWMANTTINVSKH